MIKNSDFSLCLNTAPQNIKDLVDVVVNDAGDVLKVFEDIYHSKNYLKTTKQIVKKYKKKKNQ